MPLRKPLPALALTLLLTGCAGTDFVRPAPGALTIGQSTQADVTAKLGSPRQTGELTKNDKQLKVLKYVYAQNGGAEPAYPDVIPARSMSFAFFGDTLVSDEYISSFKVDATDFDGAKVAQIVKGKSRRDEVVALLGKPSGEAVYPLIKKADERALVYSYAQAKGNVFNMKFHAKTLVVPFDRGGVVTDVEYVTTGDR